MPDYQIFRGLEANLPTLLEGQVALTTDTKRYFVGTNTGNMELSKKEDIITLNEQLVDTENTLNGTNQGEKINVPGAMRLALRQRRPMISFVSDDGTIQDFTILKAIFEFYGITCGVALISSFIGNSGYMAKSHIDVLYGLGWEVMSHTVNHAHLAELTTEDAIESELRDSKETLKSMGYEVNTIIYPFGSEDERVRRLARKYYRTGAISYNGRNDFPLATYRMNRVALGSYFDAGTGTDTYEYYKSHVDACRENNEYLIFELHPGNPVFDATQQQYLRDIIEYIQSLNIEIVNVNEAIEEIGNLIDTGDYVKGEANPHFVVSCDGSGFSSDGENSPDDSKRNLVENYNFELNGLMDYINAYPSDVNVTLNTSSVRSGKYSMKILRSTTSNRYIAYSMRNVDNFKGKWVTAGAWVMCPNTNTGEMRLGIQDGINFTLSDPVPRDGNWHFISAKQLVGASATVLQLNIGRVTTNGLANDIMYVDSLYAIEGTSMSPTIVNYPVHSSTDLASSATGVEGNIAYNANYLFFSVGDNSWKRIQWKNRTEYTANNAFTLSTLITGFLSNTITITPITTAFASANGFPGGAGGYFSTFRLNDDVSFNYQLYETLDGKVYRRNINNADNSWYGWTMPNINAGTTANRPTVSTVGFQYFDTTLQKPIWWGGSAWKDATGATV